MSTIYVSDVLFRDNGIDPASYLLRLPAVKHLAEAGRLTLTSPVTLLVGENGTGKSTLLEAIAVAFGFNPEGGSRNFCFSTNDTHSELCQHLRLAKRSHPRDGFFLRAESLYNVATNIDEMDEAPSFDPPVIEGYGGISLHHQSHGESFLAIVQNRFFGKGLYILDEPEAALSPMKQLTLMAEIKSLVERDSQFIIATHSPILMAFPEADLWELSDRGIERKHFRDTEHYQITKQFLENPERMLRYLMG